MKRIVQMLSWLALAGTLAAPCLYYLGNLDLESVQSWLLLATVVWFLATPFWMEHRVGS